MSHVLAQERTSIDFGQKLREARERRGVSLRQIANATKIAVRVLEALERNDVSKLPGGIFGRAFVRSYAVEVGLDPEDTIRDFMAQFPDDSVTAGHPTSAKAEDHEAVESSRRTATTFLRLILLSVPLAGALLYFGVVGPRASRPAAEAPAPVPGSAPASSPGPVAAPAAPDHDEAPAGRLSVTLSASRACWVSATVDGEKQVERVLQPGEPIALEARRELVLTAGDAEAITMTVNGADARPLGKAGELVTWRLTLANFKKYLTVR